MLINNHKITCAVWLMFGTVGLLSTIRFTSTADSFPKPPYKNSQSPNGSSTVIMHVNRVEVFAICEEGGLGAGFLGKNGRSDRIRTCDFVDPNHAL